MKSKKKSATKKVPLRIMVDRDTIMLLKTQAALSNKSVSVIVEDLIRKKIKVKDLVENLTASEVSTNIVPGKNL